MPIHDWTRVDAGIFHDFHLSWIGELRKVLNRGLLPDGFYAMAEQHGGKSIADVLTLAQVRPAETKLLPTISGGLAVAQTPPKVRRQLTQSPTARARRRTLAIRHVSGDRLVAVLEVVSPANKDRAEHFDALLNKFEDALNQGIHLLVIDLFPPTRRDPRGLHAALWNRLGDEDENEGSPEQRTLASYVADAPIRAYQEPVEAGSVLPDMPLFLDPDTYVNVPLEATYQESWSSTPMRWREVLEK